VGWLLQNLKYKSLMVRIVLVFGVSRCELCYDNKAWQRF
jgi:hypothetical protein